MGLLKFETVADAEKEWRWPSFSPSEMACKGSGKVYVESVLLDMLERLRARVRAVPGYEEAKLPVSSGYRSPEHNAKVSGTGLTGPHTTGGAVDLSVSGALGMVVLKIACTMPFQGIGLSQKGPHGSRFIHLDVLPNGPNCPRPWIWSY